MSCLTVLAAPKVPFDLPRIPLGRHAHAGETADPGRLQFAGLAAHQGLSGSGKNARLSSSRSSAAAAATIPNPAPAKINDGNNGLSVYGSVTTWRGTCGGTREGRSAATVFEFASNPERLDCRH
jgi:hypothetical protein